MELKQYVSVLWRWSWLIVLATGLAAGISYQVASSLPRVYSATTTLLVGTVLQSANPNASDLSTSQQLAQTYALMVKRQPLLQATVQALGYQTSWDALGSKISATVVPQAQLIQISALDTVPERAQAVADEVARQLILQSPTPIEKEQDQRQEFVTQQLTQLQTRISQAEDELKSLQNQLVLESSARGVQDIQGQISALQQKIATWQATYASLLNNRVGRVNNLTVVEAALASSTPVSPNVPLTVATAALGGLALALGAIVLLEYLDDTVKSTEDVERVLKLPTLGLVSRRRLRTAADQLIAWREPNSAIAEAYRVLRTNLDFAALRSAVRTLLVTSATVGEGKSTTACNLAVTMALTGRHVILVDADLRRPSVHRIFGISNGIGLTTLLLNERMPTEDALIATSVPGLSVLPSGAIPPNPAELLGSEPMAERVKELRALADTIIFDSPAILPIADTPILGALCDGVVLVVDSAHTRSDVARQGKASLDLVRLKVLGVVLNKTSSGSRIGSEYYTTGSYTRQPRRWLSLTALWTALGGSSR
jgi:capsular exopolysaccharide synthesis family protein